MFYINTDLVNSKNELNTAPYFLRIGRPIRFFFRIVHYVREVTRCFLSSASKLFLIVIYNKINLFDI
jgi:hypothetical protein